MRSVFSGTKIRKSVVLTGGLGTSLTPLTKYRPVSMVPVLNRPLIEHTIACLKNSGMTDIIIAGSRGSHSSTYKDFLSNTAGSPRVRYVEDDRPRGTAGVLRDLRDHIDGEPFLVISGNCFLGDVDLDAVLDFHDEKNAALTIVVKRTQRFSPEGVHCSAEGLVNGLTRIHASRERRSSLESAGVYVFDPRALEYVDEWSYFDIKEQLVPVLRNGSLPVYAYETRRFCKALYVIKDYFDLHRALLFNANGPPPGEGMTKIADGVWAGSNVSLSPKAYILGPVVIGSDTVVERNAQIIGPAVIGEGCKIEKGALVRESILWDDAVIEHGARVQYCIIEQGMRATSGESFSSMVILEKCEAEDAELMALNHEFHGIKEMNPPVLNGRKYTLFLKRLMDILLSIPGLAAILPLLLLIALAIKLDSDGPVFFRQKRCRKSGRDFEMLKFRTMVQDAEKYQQKLAARKDTDGPMFKLADDPRVTRVGAFLRRTSLDELPQLINVLRGEMSLVGPRPLVMNEMKCSPSWRDIRLRVKPGITGLWQVSGRSEAHFHDWIRHDVHYVMNQSLLLDLKILCKTVKVVLKKVGAY